MIIFEIFSNTPHVPSWTVTLYFEEFLIGALARCDLKLPKSTGVSTILKAKQTEKGLVIKGHNQEYFWVDGKKVQGNKLVLPKQLIKVGETTFTIKENHFDKVNRTLDIADQYERFAEEKSEYMPILEAMEKEILYADGGLITPKPDSEIDL